MNKPNLFFQFRQYSFPRNEKVTKNIKVKILFKKKGGWGIWSGKKGGTNVIYNIQLLKIQSESRNPRWHEARRAGLMPAFPAAPLLLLGLVGQLYKMRDNPADLAASAVPSQLSEPMRLTLVIYIYTTRTPTVSVFSFFFQRSKYKQTANTIQHLSPL